MAVPIWRQSTACINQTFVFATFLHIYILPNQSLLLLIPQYSLPRERIRPLLKVLIDKEINLLLCFPLFNILPFKPFALLPELFQVVFGLQIDFSFVHQPLIHFIPFSRF